MDHAYIDEHDLYEAYLAGRLSEAERDEFEAHYFDCEECLRQLELAEDFRTGARDAGPAPALTAGRQEALEAVGFLAALAILLRSHRLRALALGGALLALLAVPVVLLLRADWRASTSSGQRIAELEARLRGLEADSAAERRSFLAELARHRQTLAEQEEKVAQAIVPPIGRPQTNVQIVTLTAVRGGEEGREPVNHLLLPADLTPTVVTVELALNEYPAYRARLRDGTGREIWSAGNVYPNGHDTIVLLFPHTLLRGGRYELTLEGERKGQAPARIGVYPFEVERSKAGRN